MDLTYHNSVNLPKFGALLPPDWNHGRVFVLVLTLVLAGCHLSSRFENWFIVMCDFGGQINIHVQ